jgi:hypothetical protein
MSKVFLGLGVTALALGAYQYYTISLTKTQAPKHRLTASNDDSSNNAVQVAIDSISMLIWGLVAAKAKTGLCV